MMRYDYKNQTVFFLFAALAFGFVTYFTYAVGNEQSTQNAYTGLMILIIVLGGFTLLLCAFLLISILKPNSYLEITPTDIRRKSLSGETKIWAFNEIDSVNEDWLWGITFLDIYGPPGRLTISNRAFNDKEAYLDIKNRVMAGKLGLIVPEKAEKT